VEVERLAQRYDVTLDWQPFELRPGAPETGWAVPPHIRARMGAADNPLTMRAKALGITLVEREWVPSSRRAHECTEYARANGKLEPFHAAILRAYWSEASDIHAWDVLHAAAREAALDPQAMQEAVLAGAFVEAVDERVTEAHDMGIHAVPTFVIAERYAVQGAQTLEVFERVMAQIGVPPK
jgi:predicted DsbA family dithiol-disulfide isomerase